jgi:hypothetical protein
LINNNKQTNKQINKKEKEKEKEKETVGSVDRLYYIADLDLVVLCCSFVQNFF